MALDSHGNLYITTTLGNKVLKLDTNGALTIIAGTGSTGFFGDGGPATSAMLNQPLGITLDTSGNIFFADILNQRVRKIDITTGVISTIAGIGPGGFGTGGFSGDSGLATAAALNEPYGVCFDNLGNLYISDGLNGRIRQINTSGIITTVVGNGYGYTGDGGAATSANCAPTYNIIFDDSGNFYFPQEGHGGSSHTVRKVNTLGIISTIAGDSSSFTYNGDGIPATTAYMNPGFLAFDENALLCISDTYNNRIRRIDNTGIIHTITGDGIGGFSGDNGPATSAEIHSPSGIVFDHCGNLLFGDVNNERIRKVAFNPVCWPLEVPKIMSNYVFIFPNPATEEINIDGVKSKTNYSLLNINGIIEQSGTLKTGSNSINIRALPPGVYLLELTDNEGGKTMRKIVKE